MKLIETGQAIAAIDYYKGGQVRRVEYFDPDKAGANAGEASDDGDEDREWAEILKDPASAAALKKLIDKAQHTVQIAHPQGIRWLQTSGSGEATSAGLIITPTSSGSR